MVRSFFKMSGSGNDFVVIDGREGFAEGLTDRATVARLCARGTGVGADGLVIVEDDPELDFRMMYFNRDGSRAEMCGNAGLCVARLAAQLGAAPADGMRFTTDAGPVHARITADGLPEIDLGPVTVFRADLDIPLGAGEVRMGYTEAGVPHLVALCSDVENLDVEGRGATLRRHASLPRGANVNFVSRTDAGWSIRTFERGVEGETLACGTGAVATAILLNVWEESGDRTILLTRSGAQLSVRLRRSNGSWLPSLSGEGRIVFRGELAEI